AAGASRIAPPGGNEPLQRLHERVLVERPVHLVAAGAPVLARHLPEAAIRERPRELARVHLAEAIALARERQDRVRTGLDLAVHGTREVDAEERKLGIGHRIDEPAHDLLA